GCPSCSHRRAHATARWRTHHDREDRKRGLPMKLVPLLFLTCSPFLHAQRIEHFELRPAADGLRLYITVLGEDRLISSRATKAWQGWTPQTLIYAERLTQGSLAKRL